MSFRDELRDLLNQQNYDTEANTSDFILATFLIQCLDAFTTAMDHRDRLQEVVETYQRYKAEDGTE